MDNGKIAAVGTHDELLANNKIYQEVYYSQNKIGATADVLKKTREEEGDGNGKA